MPIQGLLTEIYKEVQKIPASILVQPLVDKTTTIISNESNILVNELI